MNATPLWYRVGLGLLLVLAGAEGAAVVLLRLRSHPGAGACRRAAA